MKSNFNQLAVESQEDESESDDDEVVPDDDVNEMRAFMHMFMDLVGIFSEDQNGGEEKNETRNGGINGENYC